MNNIVMSGGNWILDMSLPNEETDERPKNFQVPKNSKLSRDSLFAALQKKDMTTAQLTCEVRVDN
jgi:hypothetical protein